MYISSLKRFFASAAVADTKVVYMKEKRRCSSSIKKKKNCVLCLYDICASLCLSICRSVNRECSGAYAHAHAHAQKTESPSLGEPHEEVHELQRVSFFIPAAAPAAPAAVGKPRAPPHKQYPRGHLRRKDAKRREFKRQLSTFEATTTIETSRS